MRKLSTSDSHAIAAFLLSKPIAAYPMRATFYTGFNPFSGKPYACTYPSPKPDMRNATATDILPYIT